MTLDKALTWFGYGWIGLIVILNICAMIGFLIVGPTIWDSIGKIQDTYSPWNIVNWIFELVCVSPAIAAFWWRDKRRRQVQATE